MLFKNATVLKIDGEVPNWIDLEDTLSKRPLIHPGKAVIKISGWVPVTDDRYVVQTDDGALIRLGTAERVLPASVVADQVAQWAKAFEETSGFKPGSKMKREAKQRITLELLAHAFIKTGSILVYLNREHMIVGTSKASASDDIVCALGDALESFPCAPFMVDNPALPANRMTEWVASGDLPGRFLFGDEIELTSPDEASVRYIRRDPCSKEVIAEIKAGMRVDKLRLCWNERIDLTLNTGFQMLRIESDQTAAEAESEYEQLVAQALVETADILEVVRALS